MSKDAVGHGAVEFKLRRPESGGAKLVREATARSLDDSVELTLDVGSEGGTPQRPRLRLPRKVAQDFALRLVHCAADLSCVCVGFLGSLDEGLFDRATDLGATFC